MKVMRSSEKGRHGHNFTLSLHPVHALQGSNFEQSTLACTCVFVQYTLSSRTTNNLCRLCRLDVERPQPFILELNLGEMLPVALRPLPSMSPKAYAPYLHLAPRVQRMSNSSSEAAWCIPGNLMGPYLMARSQLSNGRTLLLAVQAKCHISGNLNTVSSHVFASAIQSLVPKQFFSLISM